MSRKYRKMTLVSEEELDRLRQRAIREYNPALRTLADIRNQMDKILLNNSLPPEEQVQLLALLQDRFHTLYTNAKSAGIVSNQPTVSHILTSMETPSSSSPDILKPEGSSVITVPTNTPQEDAIGDESQPPAAPSSTVALAGTASTLGDTGLAGVDTDQDQFYEAQPAQGTPFQSPAPPSKKEKSPKKPAHHSTSQASASATAPKAAASGPPPPIQQLAQTLNLPTAEQMHIPEKFRPQYQKLAEILEKSPAALSMGAKGELIIGKEVVPKSDFLSFLTRLYKKPAAERGTFMPGEAIFHTLLAKIKVDPNLIGDAPSATSIRELQAKYEAGIPPKGTRTGNGKSKGNGKRKRKSSWLAPPPGKSPRVLKLYSVKL